MWKQTEWTSIQLIMQNNNVPQRLIQNLNLGKRKRGGREQTNKKNGQPSHTTTPSKENHKPIQAH
jgi:hypothetical protein